MIPKQVSIYVLSYEVVFVYACYSITQMLNNINKTSNEHEE